MANMNDLNFASRKADEGDRRGWPNTTRWNSTVGKKIILLGGIIGAAIWAWNLGTQLTREIPREKPRFSEGDRENNFRGNK